MSGQLIDRSQRAQQVFRFWKDVQSTLKDGNCLRVQMSLDVELSKVMVRGHMMGIPADSFSKVPLSVFVLTQFGQRCAHHVQDLGISPILGLMLQNTQAFRESAVPEVVSAKLQFLTGVFGVSDPASGETHNDSRDKGNWKARRQGT